MLYLDVNIIAEDADIFFVKSILILKCSCSNHFIDGSPNEGEKKIRFCRRCYDKIN